MRAARYILPLVGVFVALGVGLYFVNPYAPLLLLASLIVQAPVVYLIARLSYAGGYSDRLHARREAYEKDGDAQSWLAQEQKEAESFGFALLSAKTRAQNTLLRAELLGEIGNNNESSLLLNDIELCRLGNKEKERYYVIVEKCRTQDLQKNDIST